MVDATKVVLLVIVLLAFPLAVTADAGDPLEAGSADYDASGDEDDGSRDRRRSQRLGADAASHEASCSPVLVSAHELPSFALLCVAGVTIVARVRRRVT
jgi:hypothetical protein